MATGQPLSYDFLSDEITPLDKINVFTSHAVPSDADAFRLDSQRAEEARRPNSAVPATKGAPLILRFAIARNVGVLVKIVKSRMTIVQALEQARAEAASRVDLMPGQNADGSPVRRQFAMGRGATVTVRVDSRSRMSVLQVLEQALSEARVRSDLTPQLPAGVAKPRKARKLDKAKKLIAREAPTKCERDERAIAVLRRKLLDLAEAIAAKNLLSRSWKAKHFALWRQRLVQVQAPTGIARHLVELEANLTNQGRRTGPRQARRQIWKIECATARTLEGVSKLVAEFEGRFG